MYIFYYLNSFKEKSDNFNMSLISNIEYNAPFKEIKEERQIIGLLEDIRNDLIIVDESNKDIFNLKKLLKIVEEGEYKTVEKGITQLVNLSEAQALISQYRTNSEGGCQSCKNLKKYYDNNETYKYCNIGEDKNSAINSLEEISPKVKKYLEKGCEDRKPIFTKTIEEILK